ncbi:MAG TPA: DMT family transporter [Sphingomonas sp.]|nr:DMT family transporter [Sphingomonas sp.]
MAAAGSQETLGGHEGARAIAALILANALLAFGPVLVRLSDVGPVASAFWRMAIAFPILAGAAAWTGRGKPSGFSPALIMIIALSGLLFAADLASWHLGIVRTKAANATLFGNSASLLFPIYGFVVARSWPTRRQGLALLVAALGAAVLMGRSAELSPEHVAGDLLSLVAGVFYAFYFIAIARARATMTPLPLLAASTLASGVPLLLLALALGETIMPHNWWPLLALSFCSQIAGQGLMTRALGRTSPLIIGLALLMQPVVAAISGYAMFGETLGALDLLGAVLIAVALVLVR